MPDGLGRFRGAERRHGRELGGEAVGQEGGRAVQGHRRQVGGQGVVYGARGQIALQPGRDSGGEVLDIRDGEQEAGIPAAEAGEDLDGGLEQVRGGVRGLRYGGQGTARRLALPAGGALGPRFRLRLRLRLVRGAGPARLIAGDRAGDDAAAAGAFAGAAQIAVRLQFAQGGGDPGLPLGETGGEGPDVDEGAAGKELDVDGQADGQQRELGVLGEVIADHREAGAVAGVVVDDTAGACARRGSPRGVVFPAVTGLGVRAGASVLDIHREGLLPRWSGPRTGIAVPAGADVCQRWGGASR